MGATIRRAVPGDAAALAELATVTFPLACPPDSRVEDIDYFLATYLSTEAFAAYLTDADRAVFVADDDGHLVAYTLLADVPPSDADVAGALGDLHAVELSKCYVHPEHQGSGVAAAILESSAGWARGRGAASMWLGVNNENHRAKAFYAKSGFRVVGKRVFVLGHRLEHDFVMVRSDRDQVRTGKD